MEKFWFENISTVSEDTFNRTVVTVSPHVFKLDIQFQVKK